jgi:hypothetical protein
LGLLEIGANSKLLTLNKSVNHIPEHYQFKPSSGWKSKIQLKNRIKLNMKEKKNN